MGDKRIEDKIKEQAERIPVPDSLQPAQIEKKLRKAEQKKSTLPFNRKHRMAAGVAAACLVLAAGTVWFVSGKVYNAEKETVAPETIISQEGAGQGKTAETSYGQLCDSINAYNENIDNMMDTADAEMLAGATSDFAGTSSASDRDDVMRDTATKKTADFTDTDTQVKGIMEGDIVKTDGQHIFETENVSNGSRICIHMVEGKQVTLLSTISVENEDVKEMYLDGERLILITQSWQTGKEEEKEQVQIVVYDISNASSPEKISSHNQSGSYNTSRMRDGYLYTFTDYCVAGKKHDSGKPDTFVPKTDGVVMKEEDIQKVSNEDSNRYMVMTSLEMKNQESFKDTFSSFGGSDVYYMNDNHIYVTQPVYGDDSGEEVRTQITCFGYDAGVFEKGAAAQVRGMIENSYYMHEYKGYFCFVYTRYRTEGTTNGLCVMDDKLKLVGELSGLGRDETIYSSYFMENMAYFVTFRNTDPVFAVDLSNPEKPVLKSELKLPGFSEYLHSFGDGQLLGIGKGDGKDMYDAVKFSLFEYNSKYQLKEADTFFVHQYTDSIAGSNHKAVFVDEERGLVGLGIQNYNADVTSYQLYQYKNGKWKCLFKKKKLSAIWNVRGLRIGNYFYVVDVEGAISVYKL